MTGDEMKIAFIRPSMSGHPSRDAMMPLVFSIINSIKEDGDEISFYDEKAENLPDFIDADAVCMTVDTFSAIRSYSLAEKFRMENKTVIMGGFHPSMVPDECLQHADAVIIGEAEDTFRCAINDLRKNVLKKKYISTNNFNMSKIKYDYSIFKGKKYNRIGLVQFVRGCRFGCDFCSVHAFYKSSIRKRPVEDVVEDIRKLKEKYIFFTDDNIYADENEALKLFKAMQGLNKKWFCQISIDAAGDIEVLKAMKKGGCILVLIGFESLDMENLKQMGKGANIRYNDYEKAIKNIYNAGLMIYGTFVIGYDNDTKETARNLADFALSNNFAIANFNPLMPMPGTSLYERLKKEKRLAYENWWINPDYRYGDSLIVPAKMTGEELRKSCRDARYSFYSLKNIFKRLFFISNFKNARIFLISNMISRFEIMAKQGRRLGGDHEDNTY
jgi:radical SAM superfamily enzyme YgiQ (UPF0313 family)